MIVLWEEHRARARIGTDARGSRIQEAVLSLRTVVVEDDPRYRQSLETFLQHAPGFALAGSFGSVEAAVRAARSKTEDGASGWDLVLMDLELPGAGGIEGTQKIKALLPESRVVILTVFEEPSVILRAISAGADGYLLKKSSTRELMTQLRAVASGGAPLTAGVAQTVLDMLRRAGPSLDSTAPARPARLELSEREQDVLRCFVRGHSYSGAADELGISVDTVRSHVRHIYKKLQVHSVGEAVGRAVREGLV